MKKEEEHGEEVQQRVMEWAKELQSVSEVSKIKVTNLNLHSDIINKSS